MFGCANHVAQEAAVLVTGTLGLACPVTAAALRQAVAAARAGGCIVFVDVNWRPVFWADPEAAKQVTKEYLSDADVVKLSDADLLAIWGVKLETALLNPCSVAQLLPKAQAVLVTAGGEGAAYCFKPGDAGEHSGFVRAFDISVLDTTGAGDAFTAGFIYKMLQAGGLQPLASSPQSIKEAVVFAAACGALTCTKPGAIEAQPSLQEVQSLFEKSKAWYNFW